MYREQHSVEQTSLSRFTVSRRTDDLSDNIKENLKERQKLYAAISLPLDESTDISDTALIVIFIRAVTVGLDVVEVLRYGKPFLHNRRTGYP